MVTNDILMFVVNGLINAQQVQNTYFYRATVNGSLTEGYFPTLIEEWWDNVFSFYFDATVRGHLTNQLVFESVRAENLMQADEIGGYQPVSPLPGTWSVSTALSQYQAYSFTQPSGMRGMNSGKRRIAGPTEAAIGQFGIIESATATVLDTLAARFSQSFNLASASPLFDVDIVPCIVKRVRDGAGTPNIPYTYRLPRTQGEATSYRATSWSADRYVTTQNSRKTGRGM